MFGMVLFVSYASNEVTIVSMHMGVVLYL
jgi:hypothetical protein